MGTVKTEISLNEVDQLQTGTIPVMEHFYTIQGEGIYTGVPAYFIRLAGCDVGCVWCDVKASWQVIPDQIMNIKDLVEQAQQSKSSLAVITGGEPLLHDLTNLTSQLKEAGFRIHIETSGAHAITGQIDWICLSPKKFKYPLEANYQQAHELKVIIYNKKDFDWAWQEAAKVAPNCQLLLQPEWSKREEMTPQIVEYVKQNPQWQISLQTHHYLKVP